MDEDVMPVFVIKAKDRLADAAVYAYYKACVQHGLTEQAREVAKALEEICAWQERNPDRIKMPDHKHVGVTK